jgi:hypothetical protein
MEEKDVLLQQQMVITKRAESGGAMREENQFISRSRVTNERMRTSSDEPENINKMKW